MEKKINHKENGYHVEHKHSGQKRPYGDSYYEYVVKSDRPATEVEDYCKKYVYACGLTTKQYLKEEREGVADFGDHFRSNYSFKKIGEGEYFYRVTRPSTH